MITGLVGWNRLARQHLPRPWGLAQVPKTLAHLQEREWGRVGRTPTESDEEAREAVTQGVQALIQAGVDAQGEVREALHGYAAREIVEDAKKHDAGVIIMGSRGRSDLAGLVLGSTAHKVIHLTDRPVLVIR
jgi:nucleotide-binding universal stress UspA family protein